MKLMDLVSIIITTYQGTDTIYKCVESAINQDYSDFEVVVVDDNGKGSADQVATEKIIAPFVKNKNFKYIPHEKNINGSAARNTGIKNSRGSYIAFLDDDDILHPNSISLRYKKLSSMPTDYGIVFTSFTQYSSDGSFDLECKYDFEGDILVDFLEQKYHSPSSVIMIRKAIVEDIGYWDETFRRHQDWEFITRILSKFKACSVSEATVDRIVTWRNNAKDPKVFEKNRIHYLEKMQPIINKLSKSDQSNIYYAHYKDIGKNYLKYYKFTDAVRCAFRSRYPIKAIGAYIRDTSVYIGKKARRNR